MWNLRSRQVIPDVSLLVSAQQVPVSAIVAFMTLSRSMVSQSLRQRFPGAARCWST